jgi:hypothetical protein
VFLRGVQNKYNLLLMPRCSSLVLVIALIAASLTPVAGRASLKQFGKIKLRVVDVNDARIAGADVLIVGEGLRWRMTTNSEGELEMSLPVGDYQLSVEANGFRRFASERFRIKSGKAQRCNIQMLIKPAILVPALSDPQTDS